MPALVVGQTSITLVPDNPRRKVLSVTVNHASAIIYISDKPSVRASTSKWILYPYETWILDLPQDHPERAYYIISDTVGTSVIVGWINEEK